MIETLNWGSHLPALMACTAVCDGPVLEIGCGHFSTPCLHAICAALKLQLTTVELSDEWRSLFTSYETAGHRVLKQSDPLLHELAGQQWGLVLVDDVADTRINRLDMFFDSSRFVLFHDCNFDEYREPLKKWVQDRQCFHRIYTKYGPHTLAVSKTHPIPEFE